MNGPNPYRRDLPPPQAWIARTARRGGRARWETVPDRLWAKVLAGSESGEGCWGWSAPGDKHGYGFIDGVGAHRLSRYLVTGDDPTGWSTCHSCDNPPCARPDHLFLGSHATNMADSAAKNRMPGRLTIPEDLVAEIRTLRAQGISGLEIAKQTGVSASHVIRLSKAISRTTDPVKPAWTARGLRTAGMKLSDEQVAEIRRRYANGDVTQRALAKQFGIDQGYLSALVNGKNRWAS